MDTSYGAGSQLCRVNQNKTAHKNIVVLYARHFFKYLITVRYELMMAVYGEDGSIVNLRLVDTLLQWS